jgi:DNA polymerase III epsilon subunit-like protein
MLAEKYGIKNIAFIDFETTGLNPKECHPTEVAVRVVGFGHTGIAQDKEYESMIKLPEGVEISEFIQGLTGLTTEKVNSEGADKAEVMAKLQEFIPARETMVVAQSANFDLGYLKEHFGVEPAHFICTKTVEFFTAPHLSTSLNDTHKRYTPEESFEQTHRAMDDVNMLFDIFFGQLEYHGKQGLEFFMNKIAVMPERPLVFTPHNAIVLDYTEKYSQKKTQVKLEEKLSEAESLMSEAHSLLDNVHCYDSDIYREISKYFNGDEE